MLRLREGEDDDPRLRFGEHKNHDDKATGSTGFNWERPEASVLYSSESGPAAAVKSSRVTPGLGIARVRRRGDIGARWGCLSEERIPDPTGTLVALSSNLAFHSQKAASMCPYR